MKTFIYLAVLGLYLNVTVSVLHAAGPSRDVLVNSILDEKAKQKAISAIETLTTDRKRSRTDEEHALEYLVSVHNEPLALYAISLRPRYWVELIESKHTSTPYDIKLIAVSMLDLSLPDVLGGLEPDEWLSSHDDYTYRLSQSLVNALASRKLNSAGISLKSSSHGDVVRWLKQVADAVKTDETLNTSTRAVMGDIEQGK